MRERVNRRTSTVKPQKTDGASRRDFLKFASVSAPAAVAAVAVGAPQEAEAAVPVTSRDAVLRKTEHVKKYLASARF
ncbi:MAG: twin-arginine translocation pathway signal protein [Alphaproteobacteria bacterium HGW-Alphaproteobacteria-2]|nr:MAG: twin-arginine translocation pathway signal protein [Alphaproteobacteria bacterium HGW-Alphaproteobacteria-2]